MRMILAVVALLFGCSSVDAQECFRTSVLAPSPLMGNHGEVFELRKADCTK